MAYNILFLKYNNYINRKVKISYSVGDYLHNSLGGQLKQNRNFNENDGVTTSVVTEWDAEFKPDYCLIMAMTANNEIKSHWFVTHFDFIRGNQYRATLRRDLVVDSYSDTINAPAYIEKATLTNLYDPAIFNKEDLLLNQIKKSETSLKDGSGCAWLVGFFDSSMSAADFQNLFKNNSIYNYVQYGKDPDYTTDNISTWHPELDGVTYTYLNSGDGDNLAIRTNIRYPSGDPRIGNMFKNALVKYNGQTSWFEYINSLVTMSAGYLNGVASTANAAVSALNNLKNYEQMFDILKTHLNSLNINQNVQSLIDEYSGKIVYDTTAGKYYQVDYFVEPKATGVKDAGYTSSVGYAVDAMYTNAGVTYQSNNIRVEYTLSSVSFYLTEVSRAAGKVWSNANTITPQQSIMNDAPYCAFCIPYADIRVKASGRDDVEVYKNQTLGALNLISYCLQAGKYLFDVQLLPYCPMFNGNELYLDADGVLRYDNIPSSRVMTFYRTDGTTFTADSDHAIAKAFLFFNSNFTFNIEYNIPDKTTALEKKIANCTEMYRIVSPNFSSYFEFSPYENNGVRKFNVDCTYKPYKSYIHINPDFSGLFGADYNDNRGLVITSDFSIPQVNDAWQSYQISNKNYSQIFERQIQNMRFNNRWATAESIFGAVTGAVSGGMSGGLTGSVAGGIPGLIAGAAVGGAASVAGGVVDVLKNITTQHETLDYTKDMYNYNLQNIQALPNSLASVSSFDANNKLFPFIEKYDCTDIEKEALRNKLTWNGWKIGRIGTISQFMITGTPTYIKAKLIRLEDTDFETNQILALAEELDKGVFI